MTCISPAGGGFLLSESGRECPPLTAPSGTQRARRRLRRPSRLRGLPSFAVERHRWPI